MKITLSSSLKFTKILISGCCILLLFIPLSYSFGGIGEDELGLGPARFDWQADYVYTEEYLLIIGPFYLLWGIYLFNSHALTKIVLLLLMLALAAFYDFIAYIGLLMPIQDYAPHWGMLLLGLFFPFLLLLAVLEWKSGQGEGTYVEGDILDENMN